MRPERIQRSNPKIEPRKPETPRSESGENFLTKSIRSSEVMKNYESGVLNNAHSTFIWLTKNLLRSTASAGTLTNAALWVRKAFWDNSESLLANTKLLISTTVLFGALPLLEPFLDSKNTQTNDPQSAIEKPEQAFRANSANKEREVNHQQVLNNITSNIINRLNDLPLADALLPDSAILESVGFYFSGEGYYTPTSMTSNIKPVCYAENGKVYGLKAFIVDHKNNNTDKSNFNGHLKVQLVEKNEEEEDYLFSAVKGEEFVINLYELVSKRRFNDKAIAS